MVLLAEERNDVVESEDEVDDASESVFKLSHIKESSGFSHKNSGIQGHQSGMFKEKKNESIKVYK